MKEFFVSTLLQMWRPRPTQGCKADDDDDNDDDQLQLNYCLKINLQHLNCIV